MADPTAYWPWVGGFAQSDPAFAYPDPDLSSLPLLDNLANIDKLERQQKILWPEFSWQTVPGDESSRCYQMFSPDISRLGYTSRGRVYALICPQQGTSWPRLGTLNVEVTVTGQRGWVDEETRSFAVDLTVAARVWFSPAARRSELGRWVWELCRRSGLPLPLDKARAIVVPTNQVGDPGEPVFPVRFGPSTRYASPGFATHAEVAWTVGNLEAQIGHAQPVGVTEVDELNALVMTAFNLSTGNLLAERNVLTWDTWFDAPSCVDRAEWAAHAQLWRHSIDADHGSPTGLGSRPRYADGRAFEPVEADLEEACDDLVRWLRQHL